MVNNKILRGKTIDTNETIEIYVNVARPLQI